jgi:hypothetical protein
VGFLVRQSKQGGRPGLEGLAEAKGVKGDEAAKSDHFRVKRIAAIGHWRREGLNGAHAIND